GQPKGASTANRAPGSSLIHSATAFSGGIASEHVRASRSSQPSGVRTARANPVLEGTVAQSIPMIDRGPLTPAPLRATWTAFTLACLPATGVLVGSRCIADYGAWFDD